MLTPYGHQEGARIAWCARKPLPPLFRRSRRLLAVAAAAHHRRTLPCHRGVLLRRPALSLTQRLNENSKKIHKKSNALLLAKVCGGIRPCPVSTSAHPTLRLFIS